MAFIKIELDRCVDITRNIKCPYVTEKLTKGYGYAVDYMCRLNDNKIVSGYVEWDRDVNPVPDWCPLLIKDNIND